MKESFVIKGTGNGLTIKMNPDADFQEMILDICKRFSKSRTFFGNAEVAITLTGRDLSDEEVDLVLEAIELNSDLRIRYIFEENQLKDLRMRGMIDRFYYDNIYENAKIILSSVHKSMTEASDSSLVILGDVREGAEIRAKGNIIVFGELAGFAQAGTEGNENCYIVAEKITAQEVQIASVRQPIVFRDRKKRFGRDSHSKASCITLWENRLICEPLSNGLLKERII